MKIAVFSTKPYDERYLQKANQGQHELVFYKNRLSRKTTGLARGCEAICAFVNDDLDAEVIAGLAEQGVGMIALRVSGFNQVDQQATKAAGIGITRVPAYSPHAVAEHSIALILTLNRKMHRAYNRVREGNFALDGLLGFDLHGKIVGVVGTGQIGAIVTRILIGFGCTVLAFDPYENPDCVALGVRYVELDELFSQSDIISLQCPLTPQTHHLINEQAVARMKRGVMLINTCRGAVVETSAMIEGLKSGQIGSVGLDVYADEAELFFEDKSQSYIPDDAFARLLTFPNALITGHQAFFTHEALTAIAETTIANISAFEKDGTLLNPIPA